MGLEIRLLGTPAVLRDGTPIPPPRGNKPWALIAYVLLARTGMSRARLASILFEEAEDPLAALRWNLNAVRRLLGEPDSFRGDPVELSLPDGTWIDVLVLRSGSWPEALDIAGLGRELLEGLSFRGGAGFEAWLTAERRRVAADAGSALREAALAQLAAGDPAGAAGLAGRMVAMDRLDEGAHELLVRALAASGDDAAARAHLERVTELIRSEMGVDPGPELLAACERTVPIRSKPDAASVRAAMDAGAASVSAGQASGLETLRSAVEGARALGDPELLLRALLRYGMALSDMDSEKGERDAALMHEAIVLAERLGSPGLIARAHRQLAYAEFWRAHYDRALMWLGAAGDHAASDPIEAARFECLRGCIHTETASYGRATEALERALAPLDLERFPYDASFILTMLGRAHLLRGSLDAAEDALERSLSIARSRWAMFVPWTTALRADVALHRGELAEAKEGFEHAYALACHHYRSNRCQTLSARGLALISAAKGDIESSVRWFDVARTRGPRAPDAYAWFKAYALEALCRVAVENHLPGARTWVAALEETAGRHGMRDLHARALLHRGRLGDAAALTAARSLASDIDSPALWELVG